MADQIKAVFLAALETPTDQRPAYLDRACCGDAGVRRRVEALLRAHEGTDRLLDHLAWRPTTAPDGADPTERAGRIQLLGEIVRGGMEAMLRGTGATLFGHVYLLAQKGIYIIENVNLEELARDRCSTFAFVGIPLKFRGATGSPLRPLALV
jgi:hypothetical protein